MPRTSPPSLPSLIKQLRQDYPHYAFKAGAEFRWRPATGTIYYVTEANEAAALLLHEVAHAVLGHDEYTFDVELLRLETAAWEYARQPLARQYAVTVDPTLMDSSLETYRLWLYKRSLCPVCQQTGVQHQKNAYSCINCRHSWRVNEARSCALKRTRLRDLS